MIATVTMNPYLEYFLQVDRLPPNVSVPAKGTLTALGGVGMNTSRMLRRINPDVATTCHGLLGGHIGASIKEQLDAEGVAHDFLDTGLEPRLDVTVILMSDRSRVHICAAGPEVDSKLGVELQKKLTKLDPAPSFLVFGGDMPGKELPPRITNDWYAQVMTDLRKTPDIKVVVDSHGAELGHAIERAPYMVLPDAAELTDLANGKTLETDKDYVAVAEDLMGRYDVGVFVVKLGRQGSIVVSKEARFKAIPPSVEAMSTSGAGAAMLAGILVGLGDGKKLEEAVALGTAAGAARAATRTTALPSGDEVRALLPQVRIEKI